MKYLSILWCVWLTSVVGCSPESTKQEDAPSNVDTGTSEQDTDTAPDGGPDESDGGDADAGDASVPEGVSDATFDVDARLASDEDYEAPGTVGIVTWSVEGITPQQAEIRFGLTDAYGMHAPVDLDETDFRTLLLGMKPDRTYHFQIVVDADGVTYVSDDYTIDTGPATNLIALTASVENASLHERGYILSTQLQSPIDDNSVVFILDPDGDLVWWYVSGVGQTSRARLSYNGKSMWLIPDRGALGSAAIQRISLDTLESTMYDVGASHDAVPAGQEMLAFIEYGEGDCGSIFELYEDGYTKEIFESSDLLPGLVPNECHTNAIRYYEDRGKSDRSHVVL